MRRIIGLGLVMLIGLAGIAQAEEILPPETQNVRACATTPAVGAINYPGQNKIPSNNNLVQPTGKPDPAKGQVVYMMGKVLDADCNPLPDVTVELWQPDPYSKFAIPNDSDMANPNPMFAGAGRTYTGEDGTFSFITLFPGTLWICLHRDDKGKCTQSLERAPFFNIRIAGSPLRSPIMAGLFFENDRRNPTDPVYKKLSAVAQQRITMRVLPSDGGDYDTGMRTYIELVVPTGEHFKGY